MGFFGPGPVHPPSRSATAPSWPSTQESDHANRSRQRPRSRGQIVVIFALVDHRVHRTVRDRHRRVLVLVEQPAHAARRRCGGPRRRRSSCRRDVTCAEPRARAEAKKNGFDGRRQRRHRGPRPGHHEPPPPAASRSAATSARSSRACIGINSFHTARHSKAEYVLPVPMGSPENYYGVFGLVPHCATTTGSNTVCAHDRRRHDLPAAHQFPNTTTSYSRRPRHRREPGRPRPTRPRTNNAWATSITANQYQTFGGFNITPERIASPHIRGIEVERRDQQDRHRELLPDPVRALVEQPTNWTTGAGTGIKLTPNLTTTDTVPRSSGGPTDLWNRASWSTTQLNNTNFWVRARTIKTTTAACAAAAVVRIDHLAASASRTTTRSPTRPCSRRTRTSPGRRARPSRARGFWGMMLTQGAETINGDAYLPQCYDTASSSDDQCRTTTR